MYTLYVVQGIHVIHGLVEYVSSSDIEVYFFRDGHIFLYVSILVYSMYSANYHEIFFNIYFQLNYPPVDERCRYHR